ncbi:MAG: ROK family protein [Culicoidibacterales bacterium]
MRKFLGLTITGQYIDLAIIEENGHLLTYTRIAHQEDINITAIKNIIIPEIKTYQLKYELSGVAISTGGQVDSKRGEILYASDQITGYSGFPLKQFIEQQTNLIVEVENDVNCSALAETWIGSAKTVNSLFYLSIGMGIGGGYVLENKLISGHSFGAGEVGYLPVGASTLEEVGSINAILGQLEQKAPLNSPWTLEKFMVNFAENDPICVEVMQHFIEVIAQTITSIAYMMNPEVIAIGGVLKGYREFFLPQIEVAVQKRMIPFVFANTKIDIPEKIQYSKMLGALRNFLLLEAQKPEKDLLQALVAKRDRFTVGEVKIADFIMLNITKVPQLTISEMARQLGLSEPTITRFCKKMEVGSFQELKMQLQGIQVVKQQFPVVNKNTGVVGQRYSELLKLLDTPEVEKELQLFAKQIKEMKHVYVFIKPRERQLIELFQQQQAIKGIRVDYSCFDVALMLPLIVEHTPILMIDVEFALGNDRKVLKITACHTGKGIKINGVNNYEIGVELVYLVDVLRLILDE